MKLHRIFFTICLALYLFSSHFMAKAEDNASRAYVSGDYDRAIAIYEKDIQSGGASTGLYYNLGNAYAQSGRPGLAVLNYEKSLRLDPSNSQARNNLQYTESLVQIANEALTEGKNIDPTPADRSFFDWIRSGISRFSSDVWSVIAVCFFMLCISGIVSYLFVSSVGVKKVGFFGGGVCLLLTCIALWFASISKSAAIDNSLGVLISGEASLRLDPSVDSKTVACPLSSGTRFKILGVKKGKDGKEWMHLYLNAEYTGWLESDNIARLMVAAG